MKKHSAILVLLLGLLMQVRVAYGCDTVGLWATASAASGLTADAHGGAPSDRGDRCDLHVDLVLRHSRVLDSLCDLIAQPGGTAADGPESLPLWLATGPAEWSLPMPAPVASTADPSDAAGIAARPGTRTWLVTARLRI